MTKPNEYLTIGETARRSGVATSTLRFYESRGLINSQRGSGNQRRYHRSMLRRISLVRVAQSLGLSLKEVGHAFETLPDKRTPTKKDWEKLSTKWRDRLDERIAKLQKLRENLTGCVGCGCLSLKRCALYNAGDRAAAFGSGPRYLLGDAPD
ncbi:MAG: redox-sensitive transcriptional activator SoxR [Gammaproteobacteria bacterium]|nr:redox-sensitive transcriptional activator SoxR [Gammaproteobacteria bacterium]MDH3469008.1 redox-sensitive transcriptional activator SoxR [Gammaproteobacteria bacterium]